MLHLMKQRMIHSSEDSYLVSLKLFSFSLNELCSRELVCSSVWIDKRRFYSSWTKWLYLSLCVKKNICNTQFIFKRNLPNAKARLNDDNRRGQCTVKVSEMLFVLISDYDTVNFIMTSLLKQVNSVVVMESTAKNVNDNAERSIFCFYDDTWCVNALLSKIANFRLFVCVVNTCSQAPEQSSIPSMSILRKRPSSASLSI